MRKRNKPAESWIARTKYELEHHKEMLAERIDKLKEIRKWKESRT